MGLHQEKLTRRAEEARSLRSHCENHSVLPSAFCIIGFKAVAIVGLQRLSNKRKTTRKSGPLKNDVGSAALGHAFLAGA